MNKVMKEKMDKKKLEHGKKMKGKKRKFDKYVSRTTAEKKKGLPKKAPVIVQAAGKGE